MKKVLCIIIALALVAGGMVAGVNIYRKQKINKIESTMYPLTVNVDALDRKEFSSSYAFDIFDLKKYVGFVDYVFVGRVDKLVGTSYRDAIYMDDGSISAIPYTNYMVTVIRNIKGNLQTGKSIPLAKHGGVSYDNKSLVIASGDELPCAEKYYIFSGYADKNGELYIVDPNSSVALDSFSALTKSGSFDGTIKEYIDAENNQDTSVRLGERYESKYEVK